MPITVNCACGASMRVKEEWAGRRARCPQCKQPLTVPLEADQDEVVEAVAAEEHDTRVIPKPRPAKPRETRDEDDRPRRRARDEDDDVVDAEVYREESPRVTDKPKSRPKLERDDEDDYDRPRKRRDDDEDDRRDSRRSRGTGRVDDERPARRKKVRESGGGGGGIHISAGVLGGLGMMTLAVVWFVVGLYAGWIFFYPPILFVLGLIAFFKGMMGGE